MPTQKRHKTKYPGVYYIDGKAIGSNKTERIYYMSIGHYNILLRIN